MNRRATDRIVANPVSRRLVVAACLLSGTGCALATKSKPAESIVAGRQRMLRGIESMRRNEVDAAESHLAAAVSASPEDERAHFHYARVLWQRGRRPDAMREMVEAVRLSGGNAELLIELGRMHLAEQRLDEARRAAEQVVAADPKSAPGHALLGDVDAHRGRLDRALESYHLSLAIQPRNADVQLAVADIYRIWGEPRRALSTLQSIDTDALSNPQLAALHRLEGLAHRELGRADEAIVHFRRAMEFGPPNAALWHELARAQQLAGDREGERLSLETARAMGLEIAERTDDELSIESSLRR